MLILPRQTRDKHRENSKTDRFVSAIWSAARQKFIIYWSASQESCCDAWFGIAQSDDGIHFELVTMHGLSGAIRAEVKRRFYIETDAFAKTGSGQMRGKPS